MRRKIFYFLLCYSAFGRFGLFATFVPNANAADQRAAFEILRDQAFLSLDHARDELLFSPRQMLRAGLMTSPSNLSLFRKVYDANHQTKSTTELESLTQQQLAANVGKRFFQRLDLEVAIPLPAIKISRFTILPDIFFAQEKNSHVNILSSQQVYTTLLRTHSAGLNLMFRPTRFQSWFLSIYSQEEIFRADTFSHSYLSARKALYTFDDATDKREGMQVDIGQRWFFQKLNLEWRVDQLAPVGDTFTGSASDYRPGKHWRAQAKLYQTYATPVGEVTPSVQVIQREYASLVDGFKLQIDVTPGLAPTTQVTWRQGQGDVQFGLTRWWPRQDLTHSLQYQLRHFASKLEGAKVDTLHTLQYALHF